MLCSRTFEFLSYFELTFDQFLIVWTLLSGIHSLCLRRSGLSRPGKRRYREYGRSSALDQPRYSFVFEWCAEHKRDFFHSEFQGVLCMRIWERYRLPWLLGIIKKLFYSGDRFLTEGIRVNILGFAVNITLVFLLKIRTPLLSSDILGIQTWDTQL